MSKNKTIWNNILQNAVTDPVYRAALKADPAQVLTEAGLTLAPETEYIIADSLPDRIYIFLPPLQPDPEVAFGVPEGKTEVTGGVFCNGKVLAKFPPKV